MDSSYKGKGTRTAAAMTTTTTVDESMSTLQRSSYSFRRQGSSGRIWENNKLKLPEKKGGSAVDASEFSRGFSLIQQHLLAQTLNWL